MRSLMLLLASLLAASSAVAQEPPQKTAPRGPPPFTVDLAGFAELDELPRFAFEGAESDARVLVYSTWHALTDRSVTYMVLDPRTGKTLETFGPVVWSAAGGGERSTSEDAVAAIQKRLDGYLASHRLRPALEGEQGGDAERFAPVRDQLIVRRHDAGISVEFEVDGKTVTRKVKVAAPKAMKSLCEREPIERYLESLAYDETVPWAIAIVGFSCGDDDDPLATFLVPALVDLR